MISYVGSHQFRLSANLHRGSEVMNYPWDCFTSAQNPHPKSAWWQEVCKRLVDTIHTYTGGHFNDVTSEGYIAGGDWYVITGGRQDYMNYYHNCLELTMEVSTTKLLGSSQLPVYWNFLQHSLVNYIDMIHHLNLVSVTSADPSMGTVEGGGLFGNGDTAVLVATAKSGYRFSHWSNGAADNPLLATVDEDTLNPRAVAVMSDTLFTAHFVPDTAVHSAICPVAESPKIYVRDGRVVVEADGWQQMDVYDAMGRRVTDAVLRRGVYFVKVGVYPIRKVVVL